MTVNEIFDLVRSTTHTTATQFPNTTLITWLNIEYKKFIRSIMTESDENYFTVSGTTDAVAAQDSYTLNTAVANIKMVKILPLSTSADYVVSREVDFSEQDYDFNYYATNQAVGDATHQIIGNSLFIAPRFTTTSAGSAGNAQIYYQYEQIQSTLAVGGAESTITVPVDFHYVLSLSLKPYVYSALGKINEKNDSVAEFRMEKDNALYLMRGRDESLNLISVPSDTSLE
jgi:hypothetical protein